MANSRATNKKKWWEAVNLRVGVIAAILGLATTAFSFIKNEFATKEPVNKDLLPNLKVSYISMAGNIYSMADGDSVSKRQYYLNYLRLKNEIDDSSHGQQAGLNEDSTFAGQTKFITCLMIENKGKGDADSIVVELSKISSNLPLKIDEDKTADYDDQIRTRRVLKKELIRLPQSLLTGQGILVPLFISYHPPIYSGNDKKWTIASKLIFLPENIRYKDATDTTQKAIKVRKMQAPVRVEEGVEVRG